MPEGNEESWDPYALETEVWNASFHPREKWLANGLRMRPIHREKNKNQGGFNPGLGNVEGHGLPFQWRFGKMDGLEEHSYLSSLDYLL